MESESPSASDKSIDSSELNNSDGEYIPPKEEQQVTGRRLICEIVTPKTMSIPEWGQRIKEIAKKHKSKKAKRGKKKIAKAKAPTEKKPRRKKSKGKGKGKEKGKNERAQVQAKSDIAAFEEYEFPEWITDQELEAKGCLCCSCVGLMHMLLLLVLAVARSGNIGIPTKQYQVALGHWVGEKLMNPADPKKFSGAKIQYRESGTAQQYFRVLKKYDQPWWQTRIARQTYGTFLHKGRALPGL